MSPPGNVRNLRHWRIHLHRTSGVCSMRRPVGYACREPDSAAGGQHAFRTAASGPETEGNLLGKARRSGDHRDQEDGRAPRRCAAGHDGRQTRRHRLRTRLCTQSRVVRPLVHRNAGRGHHDRQGHHRDRQAGRARLHAAHDRQAYPAPAGGVRRSRDRCASPSATWCAPSSKSRNAPSRTWKPTSTVSAARTSR